jgi:hypothetical protein
MRQIYGNGIRVALYHILVVRAYVMYQGGCSQV